MYGRRIYICPFFAIREKLMIRCEGGELKFHDGEATTDYCTRHCSAEDWKKCSLAASLLRYYERIDKEDEEARRNQTAKA